MTDESVNQQINRASALRRKGRIGIIAPASAPLDPALLPAGLKRLIAQGFDVIGPRAPLMPDGYLAGSDADRLEELNGWLRRTDVQALWCVRGGYGTLRLLEHLDYEAARRHPKLLIGYSDITALQLALHRRAGWLGLSGPMVGVEWGSLDEEYVQETLGYARGELPPLPMELPETLNSEVPGEATGRLIGGNLSVLARLVGTPYLPDLAGSILFLEDVGEPPYRIDGLFAQLRLAGLLDDLAGVVLGGFTGTEPTPGRPTRKIETLFAEYFGQAEYPVVTGLAYGHFSDKRAMPIGVRAKLTSAPGKCSLRVLEPLTA